MATHLTTSLIAMIDREVFQRFVNDNFNLVKDYLTSGVTDRQDKWCRVCRDKGRSGLFGPETGAPLDLDAGAVPVAGCLCRLDGELYMALPESVADHDAIDAPGVPGLRLAPLHPAEVKELNIDQARNVRLSSYRAKGDFEKHYVVERPSFIETGRMTGYRMDHFPNLKVDDAMLWDSFFLLFALAEMVSVEKNTAAVAVDLEQGARIVNGQTANPLRFLPALGDQYSRYIFTAFGLYDKIGRPEKWRDENGKTRLAGYHDRLMGLQEYLNRLPDADRRKVGLEILQLLFLRKELRNDEGHWEKNIADPTREIRDYLLDHVMLIYMLTAVLGFGPEIPALSLNASRTGLYTPVDVAAGLHVSPDLSIMSKCYVCPFSVYDVTSSRLKGRHTFRVTDLSVKEWRLVLKEGKPVMENGEILRDIDRIDYNPVLEGIMEQISGLARGQELTDRKLENIANELVAKIDCSKEEREAIRKQISATTKGMGKRLTGLETKVRRMQLGMLVAGLLVLVAVGLVTCANVRALAVNNGFCYALSQSFLGLNPDRINWPYERGQAIEKDLRERIMKEYDKLESFPELKDEPVFDSRFNRMRMEARDCYRKAVSLYEEAVRKDTVNNTEAAYRLALMHLRAKGTPLSYDKGYKYASIARRHGLNARGLCAFAMIRLDSDRDSLEIESEVFGLRGNTTDPFAPLVTAIWNLAKQKKSMHPDVRKMSESLMDVIDVAALDNDASELAGLFAAQVLLAGLRDGNNQIIPCIDLDKGLMILRWVAENYNSTIAFGYFGALGSSLGLSSFILPAFGVAASTGHVEAANMALNYMYGAGIDPEETRKKWPAIFEREGSVEVNTLLPEMQKAIDEKEYSVAIHKFNEIKAICPDGFEISDHNMIEFIKLNIPDSARNILSLCERLPLREDLEFIGDPDSITRREAAMAYVRSLYAFVGFGGEKEDSIKSDSLLNVAADKGMVEAYITLAMNKYGTLSNGLYHDNADEAFGLMAVAAKHSDRARIWMAEMTRQVSPATSRKYVSEISDSLNLYKIIREIDDAVLDSYVKGVKIGDNKKLRRLDMLLTNSVDLFEPQTVVEENVLLSYLGIMSAIYNRKVSMTEMFSVSSFNKDWTSGLYFMPIEIAINIDVGNVRHLVDDYKGMAGEWLHLPETKTSAYLRTRVEGRIKDQFLNYNPVLPEYPYKVWSRITKGYDLYRMPSEIYQFPE